MRQLKIAKQVTQRDTLSVDKYLQEISKLPMLLPEQEVDLARKIKEGDQQALNLLVKSNLRFVISVAKQYQNQGLSLGDLISEGNLGLIKAAQRFDETRGFKYISYAVWWIRQSILQALAEQSRIVRLPQNKIGSINKINKYFAELQQKFEREPSIDEIAEMMQTSPEMVSEIYHNAGRHISMDAPLAGNEEMTLTDILSSNDMPATDKSLINNSLQKEINRLLSVLTERETIIIKMYFGLDNNPPASLEEISLIIGLTPERIRQLKEKAIKRLKHSSKNELIKHYLG
jgi:RNA polymerase primary sigma factor